MKLIVGVSFDVCVCVWLGGGGWILFFSGSVSVNFFSECVAVILDSAIFEIWLSQIDFEGL